MLSVLHWCSTVFWVCWSDGWSIVCFWAWFQCFDGFYESSASVICLSYYFSQSMDSSVLDIVDRVDYVITHRDQTLLFFSSLPTISVPFFFSHRSAYLPSSLSVCPILCCSCFDDLYLHHFLYFWVCLSVLLLPVSVYFCMLQILRYFDAQL